MKKHLLLFLFMGMILTGYSQCNCDAPQLFDSNLEDMEIGEVYLSWELPDCLNYGSSDQFNGLNLYRNGELKKTFSPTEASGRYYYDYLPGNGLYIYELTALWIDGCESAPLQATVIMQPAVCENMEIGTLPYRENFDTYPAGPGNYPDCWLKLSTNADSIYISDRQFSSRARSLYMGTTPQTFGIAVLPPTSNTIDISQIQLSFRVFKDRYYYINDDFNDNYSIDIGIMTDPTDINTFTLIERIMPASKRTWENYTVYFNDYQGDGRYIALRSDRRDANGYNSLYIDNITIERIPACMTVGNVKFEDISFNSAMITWDAVPVYEDASYTIEISEQNQNQWTSYVTNDHFFLATGLQENKAYDIRITTNCGGTVSNSYTKTIHTRCYTDQVYFTADTGRSKYRLPLSSYDEYSFSQQIFLWTEISAATITGMSLEFVYMLPATSKNDVAIYMAHTAKTNFTSNRDWSTDPLTLVYEGPLNCTEGWNDILFDTPFEYTGGRNNLLIVVHDRSGAMEIHGHEQRFYTHTTANNRALITHSNSINPAAPTGNGTLLRQRNNIKFFSCAPNNTTCTPSTLNVTNIAGSTAHLTWTPGSSETILQYRSAGDEDWTDIALSGSATDYILDNLSPNSRYEARVRSQCYDTVSRWSTISFMTVCDDFITIPWQENFDKYSVRLETFMPDCWTQLPTHANNPTVSHAKYQSYPNAFHLSSVPTTYSIAVLPAIDPALDIRTLQLKMDLLQENPDYQLEVGIMTDPDDASTFTLVETISLPKQNSWEEIIVYLNTYTGPDAHYIALRSDRREERRSNALFVDNLELDTIPQCSTPGNVAFSYIGGSSALISWIPGVLGDPEEVKLEYYHPGMSGWATHHISDNHYIFRGLPEFATIEVKLSSDCGTTTSKIIERDFMTNCTAGGIHPVGNGNGNSARLPFQNYDVNYSITQQIFHTAELQGVTSIYGISFEYTGMEPITNKFNVALYLANTSKSSFTSANDWDLTPITLVYDGPFNCVPGWNEFVFETPFAYNGYDNLLLVCHDYSFSQNSPNETFSTHTTPDRLSLQWSTLEENLHANNPPFPSEASGFPGGRNNVRFKTDCDAKAGCFPPNLIITELNGNSLELHLIPGNDESSWYVEYKSENDQNWTSLGIITDENTPFTNLTPLTNYTFRVVSHCEGNLISDTTELAVRTPCGYINTLPIRENFAGYDILPGYEIIPECWESLTNNNVIPYIQTNIIHIGFAYSDTNFLMMQSDGAGTYSIVSMNELGPAIPSNEVELSFMLNTLTRGNTLEVGVIDDPLDPSTFILVEAITPTTPGDYTYFSVPFGTYRGEGKFPAFRVAQGNAHYLIEAHLDDISIDPLPDCFRPLHPRATEITSNGFTATWDGIEPNTTYEIVYGHTGFDPDTATHILSTTDTFYQCLECLNPATDYEFYVRTSCTSGPSSWSYPVPFWSECLPLTWTDLPYFEDFNNWGYDGPQWPLPVCWKRYSTWEIADEVFPNISSDQSKPFSSPASLKFVGGTCYGIMPELDEDLPIDTLVVEFSMYCWSSENYTLPIIVGVMTDPNDPNTFIPIMECKPPTGSVWTSYEIPIPNFAAEGKHVVFKYTGDYNLQTFIDDVTLRTKDQCPKPYYPETVGTTPFSAEIDWVEIGFATSWIVEYGETGFNPGEGMRIMANEHPFTIDDLEPNTEYEFYIYSNCINDTSDRSMAASFKTKCTPVNTYTYTESFENGGEIPECWSMEFVNYEVPWIFSSASHTGSYGAYFPHEILWDGPFTTRLISPVFDLSNLRDPYITFWYNQRSDILKLYYQDAPDTPWRLWKTCEPTTGWEKDSLRIPDSGEHFAIAFEANHVNGSISLDDILIDEITCVNPSGIHTSYLADDSATVSWFPALPAQYWIFEYKSENEIIYQSVDVHESEYSLSGLDPETTYNIRIQAVCGDHFVSGFTTFDFTTLPEGDFYIYTSVEGSGSINPSGIIPMAQGASQSFTITADAGHQILDVSINGRSIGAVGNYTFVNMRGDSTIHVVFVSTANPYHVITATAGPNGNIAPQGRVAVLPGQDQAFTFNPDQGFTVLDVVVNGTSRGALDGYTFRNVRGDSTIYITFISTEDPYHVITATAGPNGNIEPQGRVAVLPGRDQAFTFRPDHGFTVLDVVVNGTSRGAMSGYTFRNVRGDSTIQVSFISNTGTSHYITASSGPNGTINPSGQIQVEDGGSQNFVFQPNSGYVVHSVIINDITREMNENSYTFTNVRGDSTISVNFMANPGDGIDENDLSYRVTVYPNPTNGILHIKTDIPFDVMEITNALGQKLYHDHIHDTHFRINVSSYSPGIYFLKLNGNRGAVTKKFIVE